MARAIPAGFEDLTAAWLSDALRETGVISPDAVIERVDREVLGTGVGFAGDLCRLHLTYRAGAGPATMVAKMPTSIDDNRNGSEMLGVYEREIRVYADVLPHLDVAAPRLYYADVDPNPDWEDQIEQIRRGERLPMWVLRIVVWVLQRFHKPEPRPSVLILEDLAPCEIGDQVAGTSMARLGAVLEEAARLHAATWNGRVPNPGPWLQSGGVAPRLSQAFYLSMRKRFVKNEGRDVSPHMRALLQRLRRDGAERGRRAHTEIPQCLVHGDLRLDNICFDGDRVRALIDWQLTRTAPAVVDVAYLIAGSVEPDVAESDVDTLLHRYHRALVDAGVDDYPWERFVVDYDDGLLLVLSGLTAVENLDMGDARGRRLVDRMVTRLDARLARVPV